MTPNITPQQAVDDFNSERKGEVAHSTWRNYQYPLNQFIEFCNDKEIEYVNELSGYDLKQFKLHRKDSGIKTVTLKNNLSSLRVFLNWCVQAGLVEPELPEMVQLPKLTEGDVVSDDMIELDMVEDILDYFYKFEYAKRQHAMFQLLWHTGIRMGTLRAIDEGDYYSRGQFIELHHRPKTGTPLKNGNKAERQIQIDDDTATVIDDYIEVHREVVTDDHGREPLFTTPYGRVSQNRIRKEVYKVTRPCHISNECPHDRDIATCEGNMSKQASRCPSSISPHPIRRAAITYHLNRDWPKDKLSERANVSREVLDRHYDARTKEERRINRKQYLNNL
ncbi:site-specific integrase [Halococcus sp. IIIV-5B]|uniref:tyrosine-type recombinase/integrase n=1 Tax=Halococcus sp. IIIV-5B TaxID=2321230 RepID=UPI000E738CD1|nr:site-specific integrase [Halococcus sp. IIIV-5B]RJT06553.1 integrase [Halococcus sp. IIIV-5B]